MSEMQNPNSGTQPTINPKDLSALRESKGLTVSDISQRTRLSPKQVDLLESGQYSVLPGSAFVMGALRSYCKVVGLEPERYLEEAKATYAASHEAGLPTPDRLHTSLPSRASGGLENPSSRLWWVASGLLGVIAIGLYFANPNGLAGLVKKDAGKAAIPATSSATVIEVNPAASQPSQGSVASTTTTPAAPIIEAAAPTTAPATTANDNLSAGSTVVSTAASTSQSAGSSALPTVLPSAPSAVPSANPAPVVASGAQSIELNLARDAWVEVKELGGKSLVNRLFKAGSKESIQIPGPVNVVVGSASGVSLNWSGSPLDLKPYTKDDVARFTLK
jgi:cytoskeleton protein RodZ